MSDPTEQEIEELARIINPAGLLSADWMADTARRILAADYRKSRLDSAVMADHVVVPREEMTTEMIEAGQFYLDSRTLGPPFRLPSLFNWHEFWRAMISTAARAGKDESNG